MTRLKTWKSLSILVALALVLALGIVALPMAGTVEAQAKTLHVDADTGTVHTGDPCPDPRDSATYADIQAAINCALAGDTILVHPGAYHEDLIIGKSLTLQSYSGNWQDTAICSMPMAAKITIQGPVEVTVQGFEISNGSYGIHVGSIEKKVHILDCFIHDNFFHGIEVIGGGDLLHIERNIISQNGLADSSCGIYIEQAWSTVNILDNIIGAWWDGEGDGSTYFGNHKDGIRIDDVPAWADVTIEDNLIVGNGDDGIDFPSVTSVQGSVNIEDNVIGAWTYDYGGGGAVGFAGNKNHGIHVGPVNDTGTITIEGNAISGNGDEGINFGVGVSAIFGNVTIQDNLIGGWTCYPGDYGYSGEARRYNGNGGEGIYIFQVGDTGTVNIGGNKISENARVEEDTGIRIQGIYGAVIVAGNDIGAWEDERGESYLGNEGQGIFVVDVFSGGELTIGPDNSIEENTGHGIDVAYGALDATIEIHHNFLNDNDPVACGCGIKLGSGGVYGAIVSDNIITKHHEGIRLAENSQKNTVQYNEISDNDHGIWVAGNDNEIWGNDILNNEMLNSGIHLTSSATGNKSYCNNIVGNSFCGVCNENPDEEADATYNWWGCSGGPGAAGCDTVSGRVAYAPWLTAPGPDGDLDLLTCRDELEHGTDPNNPDTDGGGVKDGVEVVRGTDPLDPADDAPPSPIGVGGEAYPVNKLAILAPWIALAVVIIAGAAIVARRRRTQG